MASYQQIKAQIAKLEREAAVARRKEKSEVIAKIRKMMAEHELTVTDLGLAGGRETAGKATRKTVGQPKFQDPVSGKTWTGRGKPPGWIAEALKTGEQDRFLIAGAVAGKPKAAKAAKAKPAAGGRKAAPRKDGASKAAAKKPAKPAAAKPRTKGAAAKAAGAKGTKNTKGAAGTREVAKSSAKSAVKKPQAKKSAKPAARAPRKPGAAAQPATATPAEPAIMLATATEGAN